MKLIPTLETSRLILRPFAQSDAPDVQRLAGAWEIASKTLNIPHPYEDGMAEQWIATHREAFERGRLVNFAIVEREGSLCGAIALTISSEDVHAELGFWISVPYWGRGYCTEAALAVLAYGFEDLNLHRIHASHFPHNPASGMVMQKVGMVWEGCLRQHVKKNEGFEDCVKYGILASEWRDRHKRNSLPEQGGQS